MCTLDNDFSAYISIKNTPTSILIHNRCGTAWSISSIEDIQILSHILWIGYCVPIVSRKKLRLG